MSCWIGQTGIRPKICIPKMLLKRGFLVYARTFVLPYSILADS